MEVRVYRFLTGSQENSDAHDLEYLKSGQLQERESWDEVQPDLNPESGAKKQAEIRGTVT